MDNVFFGGGGHAEASQISPVLGGPRSGGFHSPERPSQREDSHYDAIVAEAQRADAETRQRAWPSWSKGVITDEGWPFQGGYSGVTWNCRGLFLHDKGKAGRRWRQVDVWLENHDYIIIQEAHVTLNRAF